jgi:hypothetical protein
MKRKLKPKYLKKVKELLDESKNATPEQAVQIIKKIIKLVKPRHLE